MKILITGINGFIGTHLARELLKRGHSVTGLGRSKKCKIHNITTYCSGSVLDKGLLEKAIKDTEAVVHLAALTSHKDIVGNKFKTMEIGLLGTRNLLSSFSKSRSAKKFIYPSTGKVYGKINYLPIDENHPTTPQNILGKSKLEVENLIKRYDNKNKELIIFRIFNVYGPGQNENFLIPTILKQLSNGEKEIILGDIEAKRDYVYIDDLVNAFMLALEHKINQGVSIYNVCTQISKSAFEIVQLINKLRGTDIKIKINPALIRKDESPDEYGSFELIKKDLGWQPQVSLEEGLRKLCKQ